MKTRVLIGISVVVWTWIAADNMAAAYVSIGVHFVIYMLHTIEVKLNRLLDHHGILVTDADIARD
jgi:hypothetical protein